MKVLKLVMSASIISSFALGNSGAMDKKSEEIQCPMLTKNFILQNRDDFPFPFQNRGGDIEWEGKQWQIWNATSHVNVSLSGKKAPTPHFALQTRGFVESATQDGIELTIDGPHFSPTGTGKKVVCVYHYGFPKEESIEASVQLVHEIEDEVPEYVKTFINLFKHGSIQPGNFDNQMSQLFMPPQFDPMYIPVKELALLIPYIKKNNLKNAVFNLFYNLDQMSPLSMISSPHHANFFILNYLLGNPMAIKIAKKYLDERLNSPAFWVDAGYVTYAYALLDSQDVEGQKLAIAYLDKVVNDPIYNAHNLSTVVQHLLFVKDQHKVSGILEAIFKMLPEHIQQDSWGTLRIVAAFMSSPDYHKQALAFIDETLKLKELMGQSPYILVAQVFLQDTNNKKFAIEFLENTVLPHMALKAKHKVQAITSLQGKDREKIVQYLDSIWEGSQDDEDRIQFIAALIYLPDLKDYVLSKLMPNLNKLYAATSNLPSQERGTLFSNLLVFLNNDISDPEFFVKMKDELVNLTHEILQLPHGALLSIPPNQVIELVKKLGLSEHDFITKYSQSSTVDPQFFLNLVASVYDYQTMRPKYLAQVYQMEHTAPQLKAKILWEFVREIVNGNQNFDNILPKEEISSGLYTILNSDDSFLEKLGLDKKDVFDYLKKFMNLDS